MNMLEVMDNGNGIEICELDDAVTLLVDQKIPAFGIRTCFDLPKIQTPEFNLAFYTLRLKSLMESVQRVFFVAGTLFDFPEIPEYLRAEEISGSSSWHVDELNDREAIHPNRHSKIELRMHTALTPDIFRAVNADRTRFDDSDYQYFRRGSWNSKMPLPTLESIGYENRPYTTSSAWQAVGVPQLLGESDVVNFNQKPGDSVVFRRCVSNGFATAHEVIRSDEELGKIVNEDITIYRQLFSSEIYR